MDKKEKISEPGEYEKLYEQFTGKKYVSKAEKAKRTYRGMKYCITLKIASQSEIAKMIADKPDIPMGDGKAIVVLCDYSGRRSKGDGRYFYCDRKATTEKWWRGQGRDFCKEHGRMVK